MLSLRTIEPHTLELLRRLMACPLLSPLRLVGGTALALQYGHRRSVDLDLFGQAKLDGTELRTVLESIGELKIETESPNIKIYTLDGVKVDFVNYVYPWIRPTVVEDGIRLAAPEDIAAMKVNAVEGRGSKKDFIDVYFLLQHYSLDELLDFYKEKYPEHSYFRAQMSLTYFVDADPQLMPATYSEVAWEEMKEYISNEVRKLQ